ncbi:slc35b2 [Symbiodinium sp. CCMP2592]|nr:slc35b2 [Symbiodinium sp. CCMP2592]
MRLPWAFLQRRRRTLGMSGKSSVSLGSLDGYIEQLEALTVHQVWSGQSIGQANYYRQNKDKFGNKADFTTSHLIMSWYAKQGRCGDAPGRNALVFLAGANKGQSTGNVLSACPRARMHIFEIVPKLFEQQQKRFKDSPWVTVHRRGWSDKVQTFHITAPAEGVELAGLYEATGRWRNAPQLEETVETVTLAGLLLELGIQSQVNYVLIDVEGKEPNVIRGMGLETNRQMFPLFQYELGGTWSDSRHDAGQWGQYGVAMYLKALGYALYLMGGDGGQDPKKLILLHVEPEFFRWVCWRPEAFVDGNLLVVHPTFVDPGLWEEIQKHVVEAKPQAG